MKIILHTLAAGPDGVLTPGPQPQEVDDKLGKSLIAGGYASHADGQPVPRRRGRPPLETAQAPAALETTAANPVQTAVLATAE